MNGLIVAVAQYLLWVLLALTALTWFLLDRPGKVRLAAEAVLGLVLVGIAIWVAGHLHDDPRPFVQNPALKPLFPHPADNGFPSDHSAAAGLLAALVARYRKVLGAVVGLGAVAIAAARVAAHVHHVQDVVAGLLLRVLAGLLAVLVVRLVFARLADHGVVLGVRGRTTADRSGT